MLKNNFKFGMFLITIRFSLSIATSLASSASNFEKENRLLTCTYLQEIKLRNLNGLITAI